MIELMRDTKKEHLVWAMKLQGDTITDVPL
jgi:hypothetical protein